MATRKHIKKENNKRKNKKKIRVIKKVEEKTPAKELKIENNKNSSPVLTGSNVEDKYREYKRKLSNVSQMLSEIKELDNDEARPQ